MKFTLLTLYEILMHLRKVNRIKGEISLDEPLNVDYDGNELLLSDILGTATDPVKDKIDRDVNKEIMLEAVNNLKDSDAEELHLLMVDDHIPAGAKLY